jgi:hypothetical protein
VTASKWTYLWNNNSSCVLDLKCWFNFAPDNLIMTLNINAIRTKGMAPFQPQLWSPTFVLIKSFIYNPFLVLWERCDLSLSKMSLADVQRTDLNCGSNIISILSIILLIHPTFLCHMFFFKWVILWLTPSLLFCNALPLTHTLSLSLRYLAFSPAIFVWYKTPAWPFQFIIDYNDVIWQTSLFHLRVCTQQYQQKPTHVKHKLNFKERKFSLFFCIGKCLWQSDFCWK